MRSLLSHAAACSFGRFGLASGVLLFFLLSMGLGTFSVPGLSLAWVGASVEAQAPSLGVPQAPPQTLSQPRDSAPAEEPVVTTSHALWVDPGNEADLVASDLAVQLGSSAVSVREVGAVQRPWTFVFFFDQALSGRRTVRNAALEVTDRAGALASLGTVEVALADDSVQTLLGPTREAVDLLEAMSLVGVRDRGVDRQLGLRQSFLADLASAGTPDSADAAARDRLLDIAGGVLAEENRLLVRQRENLVEWVAERGPLSPLSGPRVLFYVTDGWDEEPVVFYRNALSAAGYGSVADRLKGDLLLPSAAELEKVLAAYGWRVVPLATGDSGDGLLAGDVGEAEWIRDTLGAPDRGITDEAGRPALIGLPKKKEAAAETTAPAVEQARELAPFVPLQRLAAATGGQVVREISGLSAFLDILPRVRRVEVEAVLDMGQISRLEVRRRGAGEPIVGAPRWFARGTPEAVAAVRARRLMDDGDEGSRLTVAAAVEPSEVGFGRANLLLQIEPAPQPGQRLRATIALATFASGTELAAAPLVFHQRLDEVAVAEDGSTGDGIFVLPISLPLEEPQVAVVIDDLDSNAWGGTLATILERSNESVIDSGLRDGLLPAPRALHLLVPREPFVFGKTEFDVVVSDPAIQRVAFLLDGRQVAERRRPPFDATLELGPVPRQARVTAVAFAEDGSEIGRDEISVNQSGVFQVRIVEPTTAALEERQDPTADLDVLAEVRAPAGDRIEKVEFFWNTERIGIRYSEPYRLRVPIPEAAGQGFVRVVAHLTSGDVAEDAFFPSNPGTTGRVDINLVELYVVVSDKDGRPVDGLVEEDFRILEEGDEQALSGFDASGDFPLTVGMALDSSASMFYKLPQVTDTAAGFIDEALRPGDRAFVVGFGEQAALASGATSDAQRLRQALAELKPEGQTAIWEAIVYSLVQLQGLSGKKALILYTDGADEDISFSYRTCFEFARRLGIPIYVILTNDEIFRTDGGSFGVRRFTRKVRRLTDAVGGKMILARVGDDLGEIYREIDRELRSQYLLTYYPEKTTPGVWREVEVKTKKPGLEARTVAGYYPD